MYCRIWGVMSKVAKATTMARTIIGFLHVPFCNSYDLLRQKSSEDAKVLVRNFQKLVHVFRRASIYWLQAMSFMGKPKGAACRPRIFELLQLDVRLTLSVKDFSSEFLHQTLAKTISR